MDSGHNTVNGGNSQGIFSEQGSEPSANQPTSVMRNPVVSSGTGDIMLPIEEKKNNKSKILIVLVCLLVVVGVAFLAWKSFSNGGNNNSPNSIVISDETKSAFNMYANYIFWGNNSNNQLVLSDVWSSANALNNAINNTDLEWRIAYFNEAIEYQDIFIDLAKGDFLELEEDAENEQWKYQSIVENMGLSLSVIKEYASVKDLNASDIATMIIDNGVEVSLREIMDLYSGVKIEGDNDTFYNALEEYYEKNVTMLNAYIEDGCFDNGEIDVVCVGELSGDYTDVVNEYKNVKIAFDSLKDSYILSVLNRCAELNELIYGDSENE